jgi:hypothetical protein
MAYNYEKKRYECDRCGKPISCTQKIQLCKECNDWLEARVKADAEKKSTTCLGKIK